MEICKPRNQRHKNMVEEPCEPIVRRAPKGNVGAFCDNFKLMPEWCCELLVVSMFACCSQAMLCLQLCDRTHGIGQLGRISKNISPVSIANFWGLSCSNYIQHPTALLVYYIAIRLIHLPFCWVSILWIVCSISAKVINCVFSGLPKIDASSVVK